MRGMTLSAIERELMMMENGEWEDVKRVVSQVKDEKVTQIEKMRNGKDKERCKSSWWNKTRVSRSGSRGQRVQECNAGEIGVLSLLRGERLSSSLQLLIEGLLISEIQLGRANLSDGERFLVILLRVTAAFLPFLPRASANSSFGGQKMEGE